MFFCIFEADKRMNPMKKSIAYLPLKKQNDLNYIVSQIRERLPQAEMIILYGSYARNSYVDHDERVEFGIPTSYKSDYDILVVTDGIRDQHAGSILNEIDIAYYRNPDRQTPVEFINDDIKKLNQDLSDGRYFYTEIKRDGVMLYNSGKFALARRRKLKFDEIKQQAEAYFEDKFGRSSSFLRGVEFYYNENDFRMCAFHLHQVCENAYYAIRLVYTLQNSKLHNLHKLFCSVKKYSSDLLKPFPRNTPEEMRLFELVKSAYVEARYNPQFIVTKQDIKTLISRAEQLREIAQRICAERIKEYERQINPG